VIGHISLDKKSEKNDRESKRKTRPKE
jgi:hypothetical protein